MACDVIATDEADERSGELRRQTTAGFTGDEQVARLRCKIEQALQILGFKMVKKQVCDDRGVRSSRLFRQPIEHVGNDDDRVKTQVFKCGQRVVGNDALLIDEDHFADIRGRGLQRVEKQGAVARAPYTPLSPHPPPPYPSLLFRDKCAPEIYTDAPPTGANVTRPSARSRKLARNSRG